MATSFAITTTTNSILLDQQRHGKAVFSVFNSTGRLTRGRAQITADADKPWLSLVGPTERDFAIAGIEQFTVNIAVPLDAPAGNYTFRLDMIGVEHPDEDLTQGPTVTFAVVAPPPPRKPIPWIPILAAVAVVLVIIAVLAVILTRPKTATVSDLASQPLNEGLKQLNTAGLVPQVQLQQSDGTPVGLIISTVPISITDVKIGSTVTLTVASGPVTIQVPPVNRKSPVQANSDISKAGLGTGFSFDVCGGFINVVPQGQVVTSAPAPGTPLPKGTSVDLHVSNGVPCFIIINPIPPIVFNPAVGPTSTPAP